MKKFKKFTARIYTRGECGLDQTLLEFETTSIKKSKEYGKAIALERGGRLVDVWENKEAPQGGSPC